MPIRRRVGAVYPLRSWLQSAGRSGQGPARARPGWVVLQDQGSPAGGWVTAVAPTLRLARAATGRGEGLLGSTPRGPCAVCGGAGAPAPGDSAAADYGGPKRAQHKPGTAATTICFGSSSSTTGNCCAWAFFCDTFWKSKTNASGSRCYACSPARWSSTTFFAATRAKAPVPSGHMFSHHILKPERTPLENSVWGTPKSSGTFSTLFESRLLACKALLAQSIRTAACVRSFRYGERHPEGGGEHAARSRVCGDLGRVAEQVRKRHGAQWRQCPVAASR